MLTLQEKSRQARTDRRMQRQSERKPLKKAARRGHVESKKALEELEATWAQDDADRAAYRIISNLFKTVLSEDLIDQIAVKTGFQKRNREMKPLGIVSVLMMGCMEINVTTLERMCSFLSKWFDICILPQSLQSIINREESVKFINQIMGEVMTYEVEKVLKKIYGKRKICISKLFPRILLQDSTVISLPATLQRIFRGYGGAASTAAVKIDLIYDMVCNTIIRTRTLAGRIPDAKLSSDIFNYIEDGDLIIRDLGYFNLKQFIQITIKNAFYISRLSKSVYVYLNKDDEEHVDLIKHLKENTTEIL